MPGWMGMRGIEPKNPLDRERQRRDSQRLQAAGSGDMERRSQEKVQEILREQEGDMSAYTGAITVDANDNKNIDICDRPVAEIMSAKVAALSFDDNLLTVQGIFAAVKFRHLPVVDDANVIIGIISDRDFLRVVSPFFGTINEQNRDKEIMARKVGTIMTRNPVCTSVKTTILDAVKLMNGRKISCLPVVVPETLELLGIVTWKDVVRAFCPGAFNPARDSNRLRSGVKVNPETSESARLRVKAAESARLRPHPDSRPAARRGSDTDRMTSPPQRPDTVARQHPASSESGRVTRDNAAPRIAASEKLPDRRTAGNAGSDLAAKQLARMRERLAEGGRQPPSESARIHITPDSDDM